MSYLQLTEEMKITAKKFIRESTDDWFQATYVNGLPTEFTRDALEFWVDKLIWNAEKLLTLASGIAVMKEHCQVTQPEIDQAFSVHGKGLNIFLPEVNYASSTSGEQLSRTP